MYTYEQKAIPPMLRKVLLVVGTREGLVAAPGILRPVFLSPAANTCRETSVMFYSYGYCITIDIIHL